MSEHLYFR
jgi:dual specificity tyrosine-phosphorylation-regulated kinase 2/3/4